MTDNLTLTGLQKAADQAAAVYDWEAAQSLYTRALETPDIPPEVEYELRNGRATACGYLHELATARKDLVAMADLSEALDDLPGLVKALNRLAETERILGDLAAAQHWADRSLALARQAGDRKLEADSLRANFYVLLRLQKIDQAEAALSQAFDIYREMGDLEGEAYALRAKLSLAYETGKKEDRERVSERAILLFRKMGNRQEEASLYHNLGVAEVDATRRRFYLEKGYELADEVNDLGLKPWIVNGLGLLYWRLGLYERARTYEEKVVQSMRQKGRQRELTYFLETLGRIYLDQGLFEEAAQAFKEGMRQGSEVGFEYALYCLGLGSADLALGKLGTACEQLKSASQEFEKAGAYGEQTIALARLGQANLVLNNPQEALRSTSRAVSIADNGNVSVEFHPQEVWWWHYRALCEAQPEETDKVWEALDSARDVMLQGIATLSDEGLRRNYLNKVSINRDITLEWTRQEVQRGLPLAPVLERGTSPTSLQDQFRRLVGTGNRLTALRDPKALPQSILDEFVELSGAERALIALRDNATGELAWVPTMGIPDDKAKAIQAFAAPFLAQGQAGWQPVLREVEGEGEPKGIPVVHQLSVMALPLVSRGRLWGLLYGDMRQVFGRFTQSDLDLASLLANQAAAALENADWSHALERRVQQRTAELQATNEQLAQRTAELQATNADLERRNAELEIVNTIGQALTKQLDFRAIIDLVGDKIREIFAADTTTIEAYDPQTGLIQAPYYVDRGQRHFPEPLPLGKGLVSQVIESRKPLVIGASREARERGVVHIASPDAAEDLNESYLGVPIIVGDEVTGVISVQSYQQHAYNDSHMRLLSTIAANAGVALENARLFDETASLLAETQQRNAELGTINTVSQALASELELESLILLIGEQMRRIFAADIVYVALLDLQADVIHFPYEYGDVPHSIRLGEGLTSQILRSGKPLLINQDVAGRHAELQIEQIGVLAKSYLGVPILVGQRAIGVISVQNTQEENRFDERDVDLLSTIAANVGAAIQNAQLYQETQRRASEMAALAEVGHDISATLDLDTVLKQIASHARDLLEAEDSAVYLPDPGGQTFRAVVALGSIAAQIKASPVQINEGIIGDLAQRGVAKVINDTNSDPRTIQFPGTPAQLREKLMVAPLLSGERVSGMMAVWRSGAVKLFTDEDLRFLEGLAHQAAIAIENARLFSEVQRQKQYLEALVKNSPAAIVTADLEGKGETWNPAAERLFGYAEDEAVGQSVDKLVASVDDIYSEALDFSRHIAQGKPVRAITRRTRKDGTLVDVELIAQPVIVDGEQVGIIVIYHDITELLQARREAEAAREAAEGARAEAERANRAKSVFLANMSHELRTPLNAIIGFTRIVKRRAVKVLSQKQVENLDKVLVSAEHLLGLINTILDIAKIEAGRVDVQPTTFHPEAVMEVCMTTAQPLVKPGVKLIKEVAAGLPPVYADQEKVKQILINLLSNAAKFTHAGQITLSIRRQEEMLVVDVADTGIGIPEEALERVFEAFQQVDGSTTRQYGGTGLGLSISRHLARLLGGELTVTSTAGEGSIFTLTIPLRYGEMPPVPNRPRQKVTEALPSKADKLLVLAIDDDPDVIYLLRENLGEAGYEVVGFLDGAEGMQKAKELSPFAITLDIMMPHSDGWQVLRDLKTDAATRDIPVIILSIVDKKDLGYQLGASDYLLKPLDEEAMLTTLRRLAPIDDYNQQS